MQRRILNIAAILLLLSSCGGTKQVTQVNPSPVWVQGRPTSQEYYVGIGSARKTTNPNDYMQAAKQNALSDLASDISINISSNSVLSAFESQQRFSEDYSSTIKADTQKELEGYETVDTWEDAQNYWVYFRLSKETYRKITEEKKAKAAASSLDYFNKANQSLSQNDIHTGLVLLIKALEPIKPYFAQSITATLDGKDIFLGNELIQLITQTINDISILGPVNLSVKLGQKISPDNLKFRVVNKQGAAQKGIPLKVSYTEKPLTSSKNITNADGYAGFTVDIVQSSKNSEKFKVMVDIDAIVAEATSDFTIKKLLSRFTAPEFVTSIDITKPTFYVSIDTLLPNRNGPKAIFVDVFKQKLSEAGMQVTDSPSNADYKVEIEVDVKRGPQQGGYNQANIWVTIAVKNAADVEVYRKNLNKITGTHFDEEMASKNAINEASKKIENTVIKEIVEGVVKGKTAY